jgi:iron complex outermembrane recepter protein
LLLKYCREKQMNYPSGNEIRDTGKSGRHSVIGLRPIAAVVVASLALGAFGPAWSADEQSLAELKAEVARLKAALQKSEQQLSERKAPQATGPAVAASVGVAAQVAPPAATAELDAVVVRRKSPLETVKEETKSVSVVGGEELERLGATNITEVLRRVGNVQFNYGNPRTGSLTMRGITTGSSDQIDPSVGTTLDGVSLAYTPLVNGYVFVDIDTADVTRGPHGDDWRQAVDHRPHRFQDQGAELHAGSRGIANLR